VFRHLLLTRSNDGHVVTVTLNRPEKLNAWTAVMGREVRDAMARAGGDDGVRVIVLTGAGRGFCAGADMRVLSGIQSGGTADEVARPPARGHGRTELGGRYAYFATVPKPIIAALNGATAGLGLVIALYCDVRFAADSAVFTTAFARRGLIAEHGISWMLPRLVGLPHALDLMLSARKVDAAEALRIGLVDELAAPDEVYAAARRRVEGYSVPA